MKLKDFAAANPPHRGTVCWVCTIPERDEIDAAYREGVTLAQIFAWLRTPKEKEGAGYDGTVVTRGKLQHHLKAHT